jgi:hypothetical protein
MCGIADWGDASNVIMIAQAAYFRALARGVAGGNADGDWYAAEADIAQTYGP